MKTKQEMIKKIKLRLYLRRRRRGDATVELVRGPGYYIHVGLLGHSEIGRIEEMQMQSGKVGVYKLISYETYRDPWDMIKESRWHFLGYKNEKPVNDCTFKEFMKLYGKA